MGKGTCSCSLTFAEAEQLKQDPRTCILLRETCRHSGKVKCYALSVRPTGSFDLFSLQDLGRLLSRIQNGNDIGNPALDPIVDPVGESLRQKPVVVAPYRVDPCEPLEGIDIRADLIEEIRAEPNLLPLVEATAAPQIPLRRGKQPDFHGISPRSSSRTTDHSSLTDSLSAHSPCRDSISASCHAGGPWAARSPASDRHKRSMRTTRWPLLKPEMSMLLAVTPRLSIRKDRQSISD